MRANRPLAPWQKLEARDTIPRAVSARLDRGRGLARACKETGRLHEGERIPHRVRGLRTDGTQ
jgi:hypothetical protein